MSRVLVTGAGGFIGSRTLEPLARMGFEIHAVSRGVAPPERCGVTWHTADLLDEGERGPLVRAVAASHLLHLAWFAEPGAFWTAPENTTWVAATAGLVEEFAAAGGARVVLAGSCAEYDWSAPQPLTEDAPLMPATLYGKCKNETRQAVEAMAERTGLSVAWGRVFFLYGPGEDRRRLVADVATTLLEGRRAPTTAGVQRRDFMHVDDVAGAFAALLGSGVTGPVNVASGSAVAVMSVVEQVAQAAGRPDLLDVGALDARAGEPELLAADTRRLRDEVGFVPAISLAEGIEATVAWWRELLAR